MVPPSSIRTSQVTPEPAIRIEELRLVHQMAKEFLSEKWIAIRSV